MMETCMKRQLIFVVDDVIETCQLARHCLEDAGYVVRTFSTPDVIAEAERCRPALILISWLMRHGSMVSICRRIRENPLLSTTSLVFFLEDATDEQRILALESGGDDYVIKPFVPQDLIARVRAVLRRSSADAIPQTGEAKLVIDSSAMRLLVRGIDVPTTFLEFRLIDYLARHQGQVITRDLLLDAVWGEKQFVTPRNVDVCIGRIRGKIEPDKTQPTYLKTVRGVGYQLDAVVAWQFASNESCNCPACTKASSTPDAAYGRSTKSKRSTTRNLRVFVPEGHARPKHVTSKMNPDKRSSGVSLR